MARINIVKYISLAILISAHQITFSQDVDSLYNLFISAVEVPQKTESISTQPEVIKCGLNLVYNLKAHFNELSKEQQNRISAVLARPEKQTSIVTPSGKFRIHYDTTGTDAPGYNMNLLAGAADSVYNFEINKLGYPIPPEDNFEGGDELYDIYILNLGSIYGYTEFVKNSNSMSFIAIDNDFADQYTKGIDGARVTIAHEFHHAIQVGSYLYRDDDSFYYELLSTSMEEFVYDDINDYYAYMPTYFYNPDVSLYETPGGGYDIALWNIFLKELYGFGVIKNALEQIVDVPAMEAMAVSIANEGGSFKADLNKFGIWTYFTADKSKPGKYFEEAEFYPDISPLIRYEFTGSTKSFIVNSNAASNNFILFEDNSSGYSDTLVSIITNGDFLFKERTQFDYSLYNFAANNASKINDLYYSHISSLKKSLFVESNIFNNEIANEAETERLEIDYAYPQPFNYSSHSIINIPASRDPYGRASLNIYTSSMDLVFSAEKDIFASDKIVVHWDGFDTDGNRLPTGVYIYVTKAGDKVKKGKFVIYNE